MITKNPILDACRMMIDKFCPNCNNWPLEISVAKKLLYISPDIDAWLALSLPFPIDSLIFFLSESGRFYHPTSQKNPYLLDMNKLSPRNKKVDLDADKS